jgi:hypothetical protein
VIIFKKRGLAFRGRALPSQWLLKSGDETLFDGETFVKIDSNVRGADVFVVQLPTPQTTSEELFFDGRVAAGSGCV